MGREQTVLTAIFILFAIVILLSTGIEKEFLERRREKEYLKRQRAEILGQKTGRVERYITNERGLISITNTSMASYMALLAGSVVLGFVFGKLVFMDSVVSLFLAGICIVLPHAFLILKQNRDRRSLAENLEGAMRIITHEYISCLDIERAVANSVDNIQLDKPFREFVLDMKMVSANVERNLRRLESKYDNVFFSRWIDQIILTQSDRTQVVNLMPILEDMNDAKMAQRHNDTQVAGAWREYFTLMFIILLSPLLVRVIQAEWYGYLIETLIGKILIIAMMGCLVWATFKAMKINKPITG